MRIHQHFDLLPYFAVALVSSLAACAGGSSTLPPPHSSSSQLVTKVATNAAKPGCTVEKSFAGSFSTLGAVSKNEMWAANNTFSLTTPQFSHYVNGTVQTVTPPGATLEYNYESFSALSADDVWAAGYTLKSLSILEVPTQYVVHWNGSSWNAIAPPPDVPENTALQASSADSPSDVWFAGVTSTSPNPEGRLVLERWDGTTLKVVAEAPYPSQFVRDMIAFSPTNVWVLLTPLNLQTPYDAFVAHWNGSTFSFQKLPALGTIVYTGTGWQLSATSPTDIWALSDSSLTAAQTFTSSIWRYNGSWQPYLLPESPFFLIGILAFSPTNVVSIGWDAGLVTLQYNGYTRWHSIPNDIAAGDLYGIKPSAVQHTTTFWQQLQLPARVALIGCS